MAAPNYTTITGTFEDGSGTSLTGTAVFTPSATVYASGAPVVTPNLPVNAKIVAGSLVNASSSPLTLLCTDNTNVTVEGTIGFWYWTVSITVGGDALTPFSFLLPSSPSTVDLYSLAGNTGSSAGFQNPMTTLGDIIYGGTSGAATRRAGNATTASEFLNSTGSGSASAAPAWKAIGAGDLPAGVQGIQPWQFLPETYGAKGDGKVLGDVVTNSTTTITSASAGFTSADVGKYIMIHGALGATNGPLVTTIASRTNSTTVVLNAAATASVSNCQAVYGTDDTAAFASAEAAAGTYALANSYYCQLIYGAKVYVLASGPTQTGNNSTTPTFNSQIPLPYPAANGTSQKLVIDHYGAGGGGNFQFWNSLVPNVAGTALVSMIQPNATFTSFGQPSVFGGPTSGAGFTTPSGGVPSAQANVKATFRGIAVWMPVFTNLIGFDMRYVSAARGQECLSCTFALSGINTSAVQPYQNNLSLGGFTASAGIGFAWPVIGNNEDCYMQDCTAQGTKDAFHGWDGFTGVRLGATFHDVVFVTDMSVGITGTAHLITLNNMNASAYNGGFLAKGGFTGTSVWCDVTWDAETSPPLYDVSDQSTSTLFGTFRFRDPADARTIAVTGCANLHIRDMDRARGHMASPPSVPASASATSPLYLDAWVVVHTGSGVTVSAIAVNGTSTGMTMAASSSLQVRVASGNTIALTYAGGTPTWDWWLD